MARAQVGLTEEQAKEDAAEKGYTLGKSVGHFRANSKALAENEGDGIAKVRRRCHCYYCCDCCCCHCCCRRRRHCCWRAASLRVCFDVGACLVLQL
jgi:hypothetical protein